jgi:hypothetical protein
MLWCHGWGWHWLHPTSILDIYKVSEHLHMLWMGIWVHPYTVIPVMVGAKFWEIWVRWSPKHVVMSWLRLKTPSDCFPHPYCMYKRVEHLHMLWKDAWMHPYTVLPVQVMGTQNLENWGKADPKWRCGVMVEAVSPCQLHLTSILDVYKVFVHFHMLWMGTWVHPYTITLVEFAQILVIWGQCGYEVMA